MQSSNEHEPLGAWIYGSSPECDVIVSAPGVEQRHCLLLQFQQGFALGDLDSSSGTWVNGSRLAAREPVWVNSSDSIRLGPSYSLQWPAPGTASSKPPKSPPMPSGSRPPQARIIRIGRAPGNQVVLDYPMISSQHAQLIQEPGGRLILEDLGSTNGTSVGRPGQRIQRAEVQPGDDIYFGSLKVNVARLLDGRPVAMGGAAAGTIAIQPKGLLIGRDPACDYPINSPVVSFHHARLLKSATGIEIEDLGSRNGTFVDGARISGRVALQPGSNIGLGSVRLRLLDAAGTLERRDYAGNVTIEAIGLVVEIKRGNQTRRLLDPVSLTVLPSEFVALMGLAGAGKTTLMKALNGYTPPAAGRVLYNGEDLYANQDQFRLQVGYVPQDDILHPQLTVREALYYTAKLRTDLTDPEIHTRITEVLKDLGIEDIGDRLIGSPERKVISGGQRKRVNIAMELLSDPSVLFLDEPTSGLSSFDAYQVTSMLRRLADKGKTIVCTIHQPSIDIFRQFDSLMMVARDKGDNAGLLAYFGPAYPDSIEFFNPTASGATRQGPPLTPEDLMSGVAARPASEWNSYYTKSRYRREFVESRAGKVVAAEQSVAQKRKREFGIGQLVTLLRRNVALKLRDRSQTLILLIQAPLFAILLGIVFGGLSDQNFTDPAKWSEFASKVGSTNFLMVVAAVWFGCNNAARDIVGETAIFQRERMVNLKLPSYVFSKLITLAVICLVQCTALLAIVYLMSGLSGSFGTLLAILFAASVVGSALGLLISAAAPTTEAAIAFLPVVLLPFILLAGGIKPLHEMPKPAQWIASLCPTRWAYEASFLTEAKARRATFQNELEKKLKDCQFAVGSCESRSALAAGRRVAAPAPPSAVRIEKDVATFAFPEREGRSSLRRSFEVLGISLVVTLVLLLSMLTFKSAL